MIRAPRRSVRAPFGAALDRCEGTPTRFGLIRDCIDLDREQRGLDPSRFAAAELRIVVDQRRFVADQARIGHARERVGADRSRNSAERERIGSACLRSEAAWWTRGPS